MTSLNNNISVILYSTIKNRIDQCRARHFGTNGWRRVEKSRWRRRRRSLSRRERSRWLRPRFKLLDDEIGSGNGRRSVGSLTWNLIQIFFPATKCLANFLSKTFYRLFIFLLLSSRIWNIAKTCVSDPAISFTYDLTNLSVYLHILFDENWDYAREFRSCFY